MTWASDGGSEPIRVGLVGVNTSHADVYARLLSDVSAGHAELPSATLEALWGGAEEQRTAELAHTFGIGRCVRTPEDMLATIDLALVVDDTGGGASHRDLAAPFLRAGIPTFIDKPMTTTMADACELFGMAERAGTPILSCSALRYAREITDSLSDIRDLGRLSAIVGVGPNDWYYYGIHVLEAVSSSFGRGVESIEVRRTAAKDTAFLEYHDGRTAVILILRDAAYAFTISIYGRDGSLYRQIGDSEAYYRRQLAAALNMAATRLTPVDKWDTLEILATLHAGERSVKEARRVRIDEILDIPAGQPTNRAVAPS